MMTFNEMITFTMIRLFNNEEEVDKMIKINFTGELKEVFLK